MDISFHPPQPDAAHSMRARTLPPRIGAHPCELITLRFGRKLKN
jgi:hypothetical protein